MMREKLILLVIFIIACLFRFSNLNWDSDQHLHPDERFLTMVGNSMKMPETMRDYLDPKVSTFNPVNIGYEFYVYGVFPVVLNKLIGIQTGNDNYNFFTLQGRALSGIFDLLILLLVYKIAQLLFKKDSHYKYVPLLAAFFYAIAVLPIQLSHFFTVDMFLAAGMMAAFYFSLRYYYMQEVGDIVLSAICIGLAMASKITAIFMLPLIGLLIVWPHMQFSYIKFKLKKSIFREVIKLFLVGILYVGFMYMTLRFANPYIFETTQFFDIRPNTVFINNIKSLKALDNNRFFPPAIQWFSKPPIIFGLINIAFFGLGLPYFLLAVIGITFSIIYLRKNIPLILAIGWMAIFFLYQSTQFVKTLRYFIFLFPFLAIFAAIGAQLSYMHWKKISDRFFHNNVRYSTVTFYVVIVVLVMIWPVAFSSIYTRKHSRVEASEWIYKNIPSGASIATEHWDDGLPLGIPNAENRIYVRNELPMFAPDAPEKWTQLNEIFSRSDYYILSSNRAWGSMTAVPEMFPQTTQFYNDLFAEKTQFTKVKEFNSYPTINLFGWKIEMKDDWSDEAFTVYDHPRVMIYKKKSLK